MEKSELIRRIGTARRGWDELLGRVDDGLALRPGAEGELSAKDLVAHVTWYEREVVKMLRSRTMEGSGLWALGPDERNAAIHSTQARGMTLEDVRAESAEGARRAHGAAGAAARGGVPRRVAVLEHAE